MKCERCDREGCKRAYFSLCSECEGIGCEICKDSIIPGLMRTEDNGMDSGQIEVCSEWADPEVDAALDDSRASLIQILKTAKNVLMEEE